MGAGEAARGYRALWVFATVFAAGCAQTTASVVDGTPPLDQADEAPPTDDLPPAPPDLPLDRAESPTEDAEGDAPPTDGGDDVAADDDAPADAAADATDADAVDDLPEDASPDATDATEVTDAMDVTDATDVTDAADVTDVTDAGCGPGLTRCGSACVDLRTSLLHCGACGRLCPGFCISGICEGGSCTGGTVPCSGLCANLATDPNNCGACGRRCAAGCVAGACAAPAAVSVGAAFSCLRYATGRVFCWGSTARGALTPAAGVALAHRPLPYPAQQSAGVWVVVTQLATSGEGACGITASGDVSCWGAFTGSGEVRSVSGISGARHIALHGGLTLGAAQADGAVRWGRWGAIEAVGGVANALRVAVGDGFGCAALADGTARCWGRNDRGQLGDGTTSPRVAAAPVPGLTAVADVVAGDQHACARRSDGEVRCWGRNDRGQLGDGTTIDRATPVVVPAWRGATQLAAGGSTTCAVVGGEVRCAGDNASAQLGDGTTTARPAPVRAGTIGQVVDVAVGPGHVCALQRGAPSAEAVRCWGDDSHGQLGLLHEAQATPRTVAGFNDAIALVAGETHACALRRSGRVVCWGGVHAQPHGQLGVGSVSAASDREPHPMLPEVAGVERAIAVAAGSLHTCAGLVDGTVRCWGLNDRGQLGDGTTVTRPTPVTVAGVMGAVEVAAGAHHACARLASGAVRCWGDNFYGQAPTVAPVIDAAALSLGAQHSCALRRGGTVLCWGNNTSGALGTGPFGGGPQEVVDASRAPATDRVRLSDVTAVFCRRNATCAALRADGEVMAWGTGVGNAAISWGPIAGWRGQEFGDGTCQVLGTSVHCGYPNEWGLAGNGMPYVTTYTGARPDQARAASRVAGDAAYVSTARPASLQNACALRADGRVDCWGYVSGGFLHVTGLDHRVRSPPATPIPLP